MTTSTLKRLWFLTGLVLVLAVSAGQMSVAHAAVINVDTTGDVVDAAGGVCADITIASLPGPNGVTSLREAICAANNDAGADTVNVPAGTYKFNIAGTRWSTLHL